MTLDDVKYTQCVCGRFYPLAHCINGFKSSNAKKYPDKFIPHKNKRCTPCLRKELRLLLMAKRMLTEEERAIVKKIQQMLPEAHIQGE